MDPGRIDKLLRQCGVRVRFVKAAAGRERDSATSGTSGAGEEKQVG